MEELIIAEALKKAGYITGFFGKGHLVDKPYLPEDQEFDLNIGGHAAEQPASYFYPYKSEKNPYFNRGFQSR